MGVWGWGEYRMGSTSVPLPQGIPSHPHTPTLPHSHTPTLPHSHTPTPPHPHTPTLPSLPLRGQQGKNTGRTNLHDEIRFFYHPCVAVRNAAWNGLCSAALEFASASTHGTLLRQRGSREEASTGRTSSAFTSHLHGHNSHRRSLFQTCLFANFAKVPPRDDGGRRGTARL